MPGLRVPFLGGTGIISSASAYQTPPSRVPVVESTPARQRVDAGVDALTGKLAGAFRAGG